MKYMIELVISFGEIVPLRLASPHFSTLIFTFLPVPIGVVRKRIDAKLCIIA